ncbi:MAG: aminotransferase class I/II-fold pyridoxal phosphate-dependent enzyme [Spirochaetales bacterium]|nr:aminotransferase class I/II-fold pyridoxal phosphate-dependent enzyme [Spirochaetales bacterium]
MSENWNIDVAHRMRRLPPYLFGQINAMKYEKRKAGIDIIDLGMGNPVDPTPESIVEKLCEASHDVRNQRYSASKGIYNLRREVARMYERVFGVTGLDPDSEVITTIGSKEGFSHMCLALIGPGDTAIVGDPYFPIHVYGVALAGGNVIKVKLGSDQAFLDNISFVIENLYPKPKLLILNYPHNPTAMTVDSSAFFDEVVALAKRTGIMVIHDFAYGLTCFDDYTAPSFMQAHGAKDVGVEFITMSKPYNMAGYRIGFCIGNKEMIKALATIKGYYDYGIYQAIQIASIIGLRECDDDVKAQAKIYESRRDVVLQGLNKLGWEVESPRASMFVWARVSDKHLAGQGSIDFALRMMDEAEVSLAPGRAFGDNGENYVRIALVENEQRLKQAFRNMDNALNKGKIAPTASKLNK